MCRPKPTYEKKRHVGIDFCSNAAKELKNNLIKRIWNFRPKGDGRSDKGGVMEAYIATNHVVFLALLGHAQKALKCSVV